MVDAPLLYTGVEELWGVYGYALQIYCDFSCYSDMAIGIALLLGFRFNINFDSPYQSATITEFWRRWHISLSSWLKDYLDVYKRQYIDMTAESMKLSSLNTERNRIDSMVRYYENLKSLDSSFSENLDSLILEEKKTLIRVIKEIDLKQFKIEEKQKRYEKPLVYILFLLQIFGFYILILYSSYFDRTNKVNRVIAVENIPRCV